MKATGSSKRKAASILGKPWNEGNGLVKQEGGFHSREAVAAPRPQALQLPCAKSPLGAEVAMLATCSLVLVWKC
jgi:hypothetical protein